MSIASRLAALERVEKEGVQVILVLGGLPDPEPLTMAIGSHRLEQAADETSETFCGRVRHCAVKERLKGIIVLGGLPDKPRPGDTNSAKMPDSCKKNHQEKGSQDDGRKI